MIFELVTEKLYLKIAMPVAALALLIGTLNYGAPILSWWMSVLR